LKLEDMKPSGLGCELENYTDADARRHGYISLDVMRLAYKLTEIAGEWRSTKEDALVQEYERVLYKMILKGYDLNTLPIQDQLPDDLMPELPPQSVQVAIKRAYERQ
ncbi:MAG: hypothetical protein AAFN11_08390, partial [Chloroflexota bacterium]